MSAMLRTTGTLGSVLLRLFAGGVLTVASSNLVSAQQVALSLGSGGAPPGGSVNLTLSLTSTGGALPTGVQWRLPYPMTSISSVNFTAGPAATGAGKTLSCANNAGWVDCVLFGVNATAIPNGVVATAAVTVLAGTTATTAPLAVTNPASTDTTTRVLPTVATGGSISIVQVPSTWSISGLIVQGSGATVTLSGAASRTATADGLGNYSFTGLVNGSYTVSAAKAGFAMTPASQAVTISGANVGGVSFSATQTTSTISGNLTSGSGATVSLGGAATRTVTADASGNYSFAGLLNGSYTVAPSKAATTFTPSARVVTLSGVNQSGINFTGVQQGTTTPTVDTTVWTDRSQSSTSFVSPMFSTNQSNELLLAFVATDSTSGTETIRSVSGAGLSWTLVRRTNTQQGTAEIWRAFAVKPLNQVTVMASISQRLTGSLTIVSFAGVDTSAANGAAAIGAVGSGSARSGAPTATLVASRTQSLVLGVGNDAGTGIGRTVVAGQSLVHQYVDSSNRGTYWVQRLIDPVSMVGSVTIRDSAPTSSAYNLSIVEVRGPLPVALDMISTASRPASQTALASATTAPTSSSTTRRTAQVLLTNPVSGEPGNACSPAGWASLVGMDFTTQKPQSAQSIPLPMTLAGTRVEINGQPAPLFLAAAGQVNFQCPLLPPGTPLHMQVRTEGGELWSVADTTMSAAVPAIFTVDTTGRAVVQIAATNQLAVAFDPSGTGRPAQQGEHVRIYASGLGEVESEVPAGMPAPLDKPIRLKNRVTVLVDGHEVEPLFAGLAPGTVGVFQVDLAFPSTAVGSDVPLFLRVELADGTVRLSPQAVVAIGVPDSGVLLTAQRNR